MTQTSKTIAPDLLQLLVNDLSPSLDEAMAAYEATDQSEDFMAWNEKFVSDYMDKKIAGNKEPTPTKSPSKPSKSSKTTKLDKSDKAPKKSTKPAVDDKEAPPTDTSKPAIVSKSGKVEITLTPAEKTRREAQLKAVTETVRKETSNIANSYMRIGFQLWTVKEHKLYLSADLRNVYEYAEIAFGFKKSSAINFIAVCEKFSCKDKDGKCTDKIDPAFALYGYSQLSLMLPLSDETLVNVKPEMSANEIRALKSGQTSDQSDPDPDTEVTEDTKPTKTVYFDGAVTAQTWDRILEKLEKLLPDGKHIQITIIG